MSRFAVYHWIKVKAIKPSADVEALKVADERARADTWSPFIRHFFWSMGCLALVVALLFFMAYNWQAMGPMFKFALLQGSLVMVVFLYWLWSFVLAPRYQVNQQSIELGQTIAQIVIALLVGGLLALFGQVYQTGADPWQLFALWSLLISLMVVSSGQAVMWILWSVLINVSLALYVDTRPMWIMLLGEVEQAMWLFLGVNVILWLILLLLDGERIRLSKRFKRFRVAQPWAWQLQAMALLICLTYMGMVAVIEWQNYGVSFGLTSVLGLAGIYAYYRHIHLDLALLALWSMSVIALIITLVMKITGGWDSGFALFLLSMMIIAMTTWAVKWLKSLQAHNAQTAVTDN